MVNVIKLRKGLNINLKGKATKKRSKLSQEDGIFGVVPDDFTGVIPKVVVHAGDQVKAGDALFVNKFFPAVRFPSPVSGTVTDIVRGERRKVLCVKVKADEKQVFRDFGRKEISGLEGEAVKESLLDAGLFGFINQLPYAVSTTPDVKPKAIFVSALRDMPLACDFEMELQGNEDAFQTGLTALSKMAPTHLGIGARQTAPALVSARDVTVTVFQGPCPAGNVGVQVNHLDPVNKGEVVWTVDPSAVIFFGRLFLTGKVDLTRTIAVAGSEVKDPSYLDVRIGTSLRTILKSRLKSSDHVRVINGNPLTGKHAGPEDFLGAHVSEVTVIPEGDTADEFLGWIRPRTRQFSVSHSYFSWLFGHKKAYDLDARIKGGERHMIMSGEYDRVLPMDIYGGYLIKAILSGNIDRQEQLGIYEVSPEDFALAEFVDSSKLPLQKIVRDGLNQLRKENA
ncbi:MAG: Na(+)-translocating NADH-quinone reductase subunit A [Prevotella sp.]|jgi:Na+-transporting NADH:ubiquinone oxidoreductase subunit A|nr:Na(+)-translocating NADH-quinone reductase subunit A [Prevotella sp.]MCI1684956.1 Na(+)-translocating NADH-quinone reductase subunit A [Prevotella sp.]MCI1801878.1 Na(+)-translocating NADH-quinone reductase subunit A [Prevotella sp.]MCI1815930.1 Na(+)-translocating NADH-quinone reductase subunit A [Prevotella sp.]MCI2125942.1 Na(+)-translocating NADH-quinone reductase subunit A [Prevotella sp.]